MHATHTSITNRYPPIHISTQEQKTTLQTNSPLLPIRHDQLETAGTSLVMRMNRASGQNKEIRRFQLDRGFLVVDKDSLAQLKPARSPILDIVS
jgi:hypothetical protein